MKILFSGYSPYSISGYGIQLKNIIKYLHKYNKHIDIGLICWDLVDKRQQLKIQDSEKINYQQLSENLYRYDEEELVEKNIDYYVPLNCENHWKSIEKYCNEFDYDKLFVFQDVCVFKPEEININCKKYLYLNVHSNKLNTVEQLSINNFDKIATTSNYGLKVLSKYNYKATKINHIVEKKNIKHIDIRKLLNINVDDFVCLIVARNDTINDRKSYKQHLIAFKLFLDELPDSEKNKCKLLIHNNTNNYDKPININEIIEILNLKNNVIYTFSKNIYTNNDIISLYDTCDLLLFASKCEGFGLPCIEAQLYGKPVITNNTTSLKEITYNGTCVDPFFTDNQGWFVPSENNIKKAILNYYNIKKNNDKNQLSIDENLFKGNNIINEWINFLTLDIKKDNVYINHLNRVKIRLLKKKTRNVKTIDQCKYLGIMIIDDNKLNEWETIILNYLYFTSEEFSLKIFCTNHNINQIKNMFYENNIKNINIVELPSDKIKDKRKFIYSKYFYENIDHEKCLFLDKNSLIINKFHESFFYYDLIGCSLVDKNGLIRDNINKYFFNIVPINSFGFTILNIKYCELISKKLKQDDILTDSDFLFSYYLQLNKSFFNTKIANIFESNKFCSKYYCLKNTMCLYNFDKYNDLDKINLMYNIHLDNIDKL